MGAGQTKTKKKAAQLKQPKLQNEELKRAPQYDDDVLDAANLAIAIQKEDLTTNIELFVHCDNLPKMDAFSLTDAVIVAYQEKETEIIPESLNPKFVKTFIVSYNFEKKQKLKFEIYDIDDFDQIENLERQEFIGQVECEIHDIVCAPTQSIGRPIVNKSNRKRNGILNIRGAEYDMGGNKFLFQIGCLQFSTRSEVVLRMSYFTENKDWMPIHATEPLKNQKKSTLVWNEFFLPLSKFGNNEQAQVKLEVEEYSKTKGTTLLGECELTLQGMMENSGKTLRMMKSGLIVGQLKLIQVKQHSRYSFLNYIYSGAKIQLLLALDFTNSNKPPEDNSSLHTFQTKNDYVDAITQILGILQYYNNENRYPMYGFGAKLPPYYNIVSHCFACTGNIFDPYVYGGIEEVIQVYRETVRAVTLHGPTVFSQIIQQAIQFASCETIDQQNQKYFILCILTDGCINDMQQTIDQIFEAQKYPLSIIIVGIGNEDFTNMRILDGDDPDSKLHSKKNDGNVSRDLVQFVEFNKVCDNQEKLAKETLAEIPKQFLEFMEINKIYPAKGKKNTKAATNDFIHTKIEEMRKLKKKEIGLAGKTPKFLKEQKDQFIEQLVILGYDRMIVSNIVQDGIPAKDVNLVIELISELQKQKAQSESKKIYRFNNRSEINSKIQNIHFDPRVSHRVFCIKQKNKLDELLQSKKQESQLVTTNFLFTIDQHRKKSPLKTQHQEPHKYRAIDPTMQQNNNNDNNLCLGCGVNPIQLVFMPCGHACSCMECYIMAQHCISCKQKVQMVAQIDLKPN